MHTTQIAKRAATCLASLSLTLWTAGWTLAQDQREWVDSTGQHKIVGSLVEVQEGTAIIKTAEGKHVKIPVNRLSKKDQEFLEQGSSPFQVVENPGGSKSSSSMSANSTASSAPTPEYNWATPKVVDWSEAEEIHLSSTADWNVPLAEDGKLPFEAKRASLTKKASFHEGMHALCINPTCKRAAVGYTVSFAVPKPQSRVSLVDLLSGKAVHSETLDANMRPLALLNNGSSMLMVGCADGRGNRTGEANEEVQIWKFVNKKIERTPSWIPYVNDGEEWGKKVNGNVVYAEAITDQTVLTMSHLGHAVLWNLPQRKPIWHVKLGSNCGYTLSTDRKLFAVLGGKTINILRTDNGEAVGSKVLDGVHIGWPRLAFSPTGKKLAFTNMGDIRILDLAKGEWEKQLNFPTSPIAPDGLDYPDEDYVLLNKKLLVHLPSQIQVCEYSDVGPIKTIGGVTFMGFSTDAGGLLVPATFPHPTAIKLLEKSQNNPSLFLIHPGVEVSIDVKGVPAEHQSKTEGFLKTSAENAGYKVVANSPISLVATITGPTQEKVEYHMAGTYTVNSYTSTVTLRWQGKDLWSNRGNNVPGIVMRKRDETMEQALAEAGKSPSFWVFQSSGFPKMLQKPSENSKGGPAKSSALMTSRFTLNGLVDTQ